MERGKPKRRPDDCSAASEVRRRLEHRGMMTMRRFTAVPSNEGCGTAGLSSRGVPGAARPVRPHGRKRHPAVAHAYSPAVAGRAWLATVLAVLVLVAAPAAADMRPVGNVQVPAPLGDWHFTALATDSSGGVYASDGDAIFRLTGGVFQPVVSDIIETLWPGGTMSVDPSGFAVNAAGTHAWIASGMTGRIIEANLSTGAVRNLSGAVLSGNYGIAAGPVGLFVTDSYSADVYAVSTAGNGAMQRVAAFPDSLFGSGIAFTPGGDLIVPVGYQYAQWPDNDNYPVDLWRYPAGFQQSGAPGVPGVRFAQALQVSGSGFTAADARGAAYLEGADAIYRVDRAGNRLVLCGDATQNAFDLVGLGFMGMAYDAAAERLLFAYRNESTQPWRLYQYSLRVADMNGDGALTALDKSLLVQALAAPKSYAAANPGMYPIINGDTNDDLAFNAQDLNLDVGTGSLTVDYAADGTSPLKRVGGWVKDGYNQGAGYWNGPRIASSAAAGDALRLTALGVGDNGAAVTVKFTYWGDANLDGKVNFDDYDVIDYYYWFPLPAEEMGWWTGDFDMDGNVDFDDYDLIDYAYWFQGAPLGGLGAVPEPATLALVAAGAAAILRRRRR